MDKFSDFFKDLKERISSPLISSFIFSWIIFNWQIVIAIFKFEVKGFSLKEYMSYTDYICSLINYNNCLWHPLGVAFVYSFLYPFLRNAIQIADAWFKAWGNNFKLTVSKSNKVSIEKYIQLREVYQKRSTLLESVLKKESETIKKNEELVNLNNELMNKANSLSSELVLKNEKILELDNLVITLNGTIVGNERKLAKYVDQELLMNDKQKVESLNGKWSYSEFNPNDEYFVLKQQTLRFLNGAVFLIDSDGIEIHHYVIKSYKFSIENNQIDFLTSLIENGVQLSYILLYENDFTVLKGRISTNQNLRVSFARID